MKKRLTKALAFLLVVTMCTGTFSDLTVNAAETGQSEVLEQLETTEESNTGLEETDSSDKAGGEIADAAVAEGAVETSELENSDESMDAEDSEEIEVPNGYTKLTSAKTTETLKASPSYKASTSTTSASGTVGDITWTVSDGVLTLSGTGVIPDYELEEAPWYAYRSSVTSIVVKEGITELGDAVFYDFTSVISVSLPSTLEYLGMYAFTNCTSLESIKIPENLETLQYAVFADCTSLTDIDLNQVVNIYSYAFQGVAATEIDIPSTVEDIDGTAFFKTNIEKYTTSGSGGIYTAKNGILFTDNGKTLALYPQAASASSYTIPSTVTKIGDLAFAYAQNLKSITIPDSVTYLGSSAFQNVYLLESITIPDSVTEVDYFTFYGCPNLTTVTFGSGLSVTSYQMFRECSSLTTINFGSGLTELYAHTFAYCTSLESVTLPANIKTIGNGTFGGCDVLTTFVSYGLEGSIPYSAFWYCYSLSDVTLNEGVTTIHRCAFYYCFSLEAITLPASVEYVHETAFPEDTVITNKNTSLSKFGTNGYRYLDEVSITGTCYYDMAYEVLELVNEERAAEDLDALVMDESLLETAMQRGAEIAILFSHTRPDGSSCFSANSSMYGENIAAAQTSAASVMNSWMNSSGHKANILSEDYSTIGIGCFYHNGVYYWVQCFGWDYETTSCTQPSNKSVTSTISLATETFDEATTSSGIIWGDVEEYTYDYELDFTSAITKGNTTTAKLYVINPGFTSVCAIINNSCITYKSSKTSVATITSAGLITGVAAGTATISAALNFTTVKETLTVSAKLTATAISSLTNVDSGITIKWAKITGATGYYIYRKAGSSGSWTKYKTITSGSTVSYTDTSVSSGTTYSYKVYPYSAAATGPVSGSKSIKRLSTAKISSAANGKSGVTIKWSKVTGATGYYVYRKVSGGSYSKVKTITSGSTVSWTDTSVTGGKTYSYKVYAYASTGKAAASSAKTIRYLKAGKISSLTNTSKGISVKWSKVTGASGYYVYRKTSSGSYEKIKTITSVSTISYTDTAVKSKNGTTYTYKVIPYYKNSSGTVTKGSYSNTKKTVRLTAVSLSSVKNSSSKKITVEWKKNSKATGYQIQYSTSSSFASGKTTTKTYSGTSTLSKTISGLTKGKTYYVRVRAYKTVSGTKYYSAWSSKKSIKISK